MFLKRDILKIFLTGLKNLRQIIVRLLPPVIVDWMRSRNTHSADPGSVELTRIRNIPRYTPGRASLYSIHGIYFCDSASFINMYEAIFIYEQYKFKSQVKDPFIIDAGANIGISVLYFKKLYPAAKIIAFEPDPDIFSVLKQNIENHEFNDVTLVNKALWSEVTRMSFFSEGADAGKIAANNSGDTDVSSALLSEYIGAEEVDLLKMDIEGAEYEVLLESRDMLGQVQRIFIEYHSLAGHKQHIGEILSILEEVGFRVNISSSGHHSPQPFMQVYEVNGFDNLLHIYGWRE
jgi:FkbM family methyltransferase